MQNQHARENQIQPTTEPTTNPQDHAPEGGGSGEAPSPDEAPSPEAPEESPVLRFEYGTSKNQSEILIEVAPEE
jgi:hypothetical protein